MKTLDLQTFISNSLVQIMEGCQDAQNKLRQSHARICPRVDVPYLDGGGASQHALGDTGTGRLVQTIDFDVAVTAADEKETKGGIGVITAIVSAGTSGRSEASHETISRLKFSIPVCYPEIALD